MGEITTCAECHESMQLNQVQIGYYLGS